jgi:hypothetical protein
MNIIDRNNLLRGVGGLLALAAMVSACGTEEGGLEPNGAPPNDATETKSGDLLSNVPYLPWQTLTAKGGTAGGATIFGNKAYFSYIRPDSSIGLVIENNLGSNGQNPTVLTLPSYYQSNYGASLVVYNNWLYMLYIDLNRNMAMAYSTDGVNWYGPGALTSDPFAGQWTCPPTPVVWNGSLFTFGCAGSVWLLKLNGSTVVGQDWPNGFPSTSNKIGAYVWQGAMYAAWADSAHNNQLYIAHTGGFPSDWRISALVGQQGIPSLYPTGAGSLEMIYRGNDAHIYKTFTTDGVSFGQVYKDNASTTNHAPIPFENWNLTGNWVFYIGVNNGLFTVLE